MTFLAAVKLFIKTFFPFPGFISNLTIQRQFFPNDEDQTGAANALLRLQDTYHLSTHTLSTGQLPGTGTGLGTGPGPDPPL